MAAVPGDEARAGKGQATSRITVHATCIEVGGRAALLRGPSGVGKSDLALRCLTLGHTPLTPIPARLVADDGVALVGDGRRLQASAPPAIVGKLEIRGLGIVDLPAEMRADGGAPGIEAQVVLIVELTTGQEIERLPDELPIEEILGIPLPVLYLDPHETTSALKVLIAINRFGVATLPCTLANP